ncbi:MAG: hypothetical protein MJ113_07445, partial [Lachnospiraceae bacterium]|nr:hypothetical protein [Lachnospiraceae bacterium]
MENLEKKAIETIEKMEQKASDAIHTVEEARERAKRKIKYAQTIKGKFLGIIAIAVIIVSFAIMALTLMLSRTALLKNAYTDLQFLTSLTQSLIEKSVSGQDDIPNLNNVVSSLHSLEGEHAYSVSTIIYDKTGTIIASNDKKYSPNKVSEKSAYASDASMNSYVAAVDKMIAAKGSGTDSYDVKDENYLTAYSHISDFGWTIVSQVKNSEV